MTAHGRVQTGYEPVQAEFERNFTERRDVGASFAVVRDGDLVVDLWGGLSDRSAGRPWTEDTMQLIYSGTKGLVAICVLLLIDRGELQLDAPVARYWPEFARNGKDGVTVREVVSHCARLPGIRRTISVAELANDRLMAEALAEQRQFEDERALHTYHALTFGWLCGELIRRVSGRSVGRFFAEEIAEPRNLDIYIGLPERLEPRVARLELAENWGANPIFDAREAAEDELIAAVWANPVLFNPAAFFWNRREIHSAEIPGANGIGLSRSIARLYSQLDDILSRQTLTLGCKPLTHREEPLQKVPQAFGVGLALQTARKQLGPPDDAFGHAGAGGSVHGAWPSHRIGFSYGMNLMRDDADVDPRAQALLGALFRCVDA